MATALNTYYAGMTVVDNIPANMRLYDRQIALLTKIAEGRAPMMRLLLNTAKAQGGFIAQDTKPYWGIEERRKVRMTMTGNSASTVTNLNNIFVVNDGDADRVQAGDQLYLSSSYTAPDRSLLPKQAITAGATPYVLNEQVKVLEVRANGSGGTGKSQIVVTRNFGGLAVDDVTLAITTPWMDLVKMGNSIPEGKDDMQIYSDTDDEDYNYCQIVGRKWGATQTESNVRRAYTTENSFVRNGRRMLDEFWDEMEFLALMGTRKTPDTVGGRKKWYAGGLMEYIPVSNWVTYKDTLFSPYEFNTQTKGMFYYGSQVKIGVCGSDFHTKLSNMFSNSTNQYYSFPAEKNAWGVSFREFMSSNGGRIYFVPSDLLSLYGLADTCLIYDPAHFQYGHLQNMNIDTYVHNLENPHERTAEIYGQITFKRTNPKAHWAFRFDPS